MIICIYTNIQNHISSNMFQHQILKITFSSAKLQHITIVTLGEHGFPLQGSNCTHNLYNMTLCGFECVCCKSVSSILWGKHSHTQYRQMLQKLIKWGALVKENGTKFYKMNSREHYSHFIGTRVHCQFIFCWGVLLTPL